MQPFLTDEEMSALEKKKAPPAFLSDEEMTALEPKKKPAAPEFLSDEEMNKLETAPEAPLPERFAGQTVTEDYLAKVAKQRGVPAEDLQGYVAFMGGYRPEIGPGDPGFWSDLAKEGAGMVEDIALSGIGKKLVTKVAKQFQSNPDAWESAIDDIREHVEAQKSTARTIGEMGVGALAGVGVPGAIGKGASALTKGLKIVDAPTAKAAEFIGKSVERLAPGLSKGSQQVLTGVGTGAAFGAAGALGQSRGDDDWSDTGMDIVKGAGAGAAFGGALSGAAAGLGGEFKKGASGEAIKETPKLATAEVSPDIDPTKMVLADNERGFSKVMEEYASGKLEPTPGQIEELISSSAEELTEKAAKQRLRDLGLAEAIARQTGLEGDAALKAVPEFKELRKGFTGYLVEGRLTNKKYSSDKLKEAYYQRVGEGRIEEDFQDYLRLSKLEEGKKSGKLLAEPPPTESWFSDKLSKLSANTSRFAEVAGRIGLPVDVWKGQISRGLNESKRLADKYSSDLEKMYSDFRSQGLTRDRYGELADAMQGQDITKAAEILKPLQVSKNEIDALNRIHEMLGSAHDEAVKKGFKGERLAGVDPNTPSQNVFYSPQRMKDIPDAIASLNLHMKNLEKDGIDWKNLKAIPENSPPELLDGLRGLEQITGKSFLKNGELNNPKAFNEAINLWRLGPKELIGNYEQGLTTKMSAALRRDDGIPKFLLENDAIKLAHGYVSNLFKTVETEPFLAKLRYASNVARSKGDVYSQDILDNAIKTLYSSSPGTLAESISSAGKAYEAKLKTVLLDPDATPGQKLAANAKLGAQDVNRWMGSQMYKNLLASPQSALNNTFQASPFGMTAAEFGMARGSWIWAKALKDFSLDLLRLKSKKPGEASGVINRIEQWKDRPFQQQQALREKIRQGLEDQGPLINALRKVGVSLDQVTDYALVAWNAAETFNKYVGNAMGENAAEMYSRNPKAYQLKNFLTNMSPGYKQELAKLGPKPDQTKVSELFRNYLSDKTLFQYDRINMSEFSKDMGGILGAFTRFPTEAIGDLRYTYRRGDLTPGQKINYTATKFGGPVALALLANGIVFGNMAEKDFMEGVKGPGKPTDDDAQATNVGRYLLRRQGFLASPHLTSLLNIIDEGYQPPPGISLAKGFLGSIVDMGKVAMAGDDADEKMQKAKRNLVDNVADISATFLPGANLGVWAQQAQRLSDLENREAEVHPFKQLGRKLLDE